MIWEWSDEHGAGKNRRKINETAFNKKLLNPPQTRRELKQNPEQKLFTFVDPRIYDWKNSSSGKGKAGRISKKGQKTKLQNSPPRWYHYPRDGGYARSLQNHAWPDGMTWRWNYRDGLIFPLIKGRR